ncbi:MAG: antitoxin [Dorea sp.]|nr:antitoxin [Dorea sp.]
MAYSKAQKEAVKKYNEKSYDEIKLRVKKGNKEIIQKHAKSKNETVNNF